MDVTNVIAANIKRIRMQKKMTLDTAAELTGVSRSMLAQIEKGYANPTISVLWKIANGFKVSFTSLTDNQNENRVSVIRQADTPPLKENDGKYLNYPTFPFDEKKLFETYRIVIEPSGELSAEAHLKGAEEYITVFDGEAEVEVAGERFCLSVGDSIRFMADVPHSYRNAGEGRVLLSMIIYYN